MQRNTLESVRDGYATLSMSDESWRTLVKDLIELIDEQDDKIVHDTQQREGLRNQLASLSSDLLHTIKILNTGGSE